MEFGRRSVRTSKREWREMIYTRRGWRVQMKEKVFICKLGYNSDRRPQFTLQFIENLNKTLGTKRILSMVYHSQTDSQIKRINQEVKAFL